MHFLNCQRRDIFQSSRISVMEDVGLTCEAEDCAFSTPDMGAEWYPAMVTHLQVYEIKCNCIGMLMLN